MIQPRLTSITENTQISVLLTDIDVKISEIARGLYNNIILMLGDNIKSDVMLDLLNYKRILTYKLHNEDYAIDFTTVMIASKVKRLKFL